jgi:NADPH:quinone reductase-like Zn-dependent oxidoreductase
VLGLECSGVISEVGPGSSWQVGDRVCALLAGGGMAEEVVVDGRHVLPVPDEMSLAASGSVAGSLRDRLVESVSTRSAQAG